jgi:hypothetical protein
MIKTALVAAAVLAATAGAASTASAQMYPNMDMSGMIANQVRLQRQGDAFANAAAMAYLNQMLYMRAHGYRGPSLPTGVTNESLQASIRGANEATQRYIQGSQVNSARTDRAIARWDYQAVRNCGWVQYTDGSRRYYCG